MKRNTANIWTKVLVLLFRHGLGRAEAAAPHAQELGHPRQKELQLLYINVLLVLRFLDLRKKVALSDSCG